MSYKRDGFFTDQKPDKLTQKLKTIIWKRMHFEFAVRFRNAKQSLEDNPQDVKAWYELAKCHRYGWGGAQKNRFRAFNFYVRAAEKYHAGARYEIAKMYLHGNSTIHIQKNLNTAKKYANYGVAGRYIKTYNTQNYKQSEYMALLRAMVEDLDAVIIGPPKFIKPMEYY